MVQSQASNKVEAALKEPASDLQHLAQLLSGQRLSAAVSLASASGDVRLAMLICQVMRCLTDCNICSYPMRILQTWPLKHVKGIHVPCEHYTTCMLVDSRILISLRRA